MELPPPPSPPLSENNEIEYSPLVIIVATMVLALAIGGYGYYAGFNTGQLYMCETKLNGYLLVGNECHLEKIEQPKDNYPKIEAWTLNATG